MHHALDSVLSVIDRIQHRCCRELGISELQALEWYRLPPLPTRRDIAMLGLMHRRVLGLGPVQFHDLLPFASPDGCAIQFDKRIGQTPFGCRDARGCLSNILVRARQVIQFLASECCVDWIGESISNTTAKRCFARWQELLGQLATPSATCLSENVLVCVSIRLRLTGSLLNCFHAIV